MSTMKNYKCVLVGDKCVGKTSFISAHLVGSINDTYVPTLGVEVNPVVFATNGNHHVRFNVWDTAGDDRFKGLGDGYYVSTDCAIIMFDLGNEISRNNVINWYNKIVQITGDTIPIVIIGNKSEIQHPISNFQFPQNTHYIEISSKNGTNIGDPFYYLIDHLN